MTDRPTIYAFYRGMFTGIVAVVFTVFVAWFAVWTAFGNPRVVECVRDRGSAVSFEVVSIRAHGYLRTFHAGDCTVFFHAIKQAR